jgi:phosphonate transport system substrate-binding protein
MTFRRFLCALTVFMVLVATGCGTTEVNDSQNASQGDSLVFAAVPSGEARDFKSHYGNFIDALSDTVGINTESFLAADYAGVIEAQISGKVDLAQYGAFSYVLAQQKGAKIEPAGVLVHKKGGKPGYVVFALAPTNSDINSLEDLAGRTVCFPDPASTTTLIPQLALHRQNIDPRKDIKPLTIPAVNTIPRTVRHGDCDAGFAGDVALENAIRTGDVKEGELKVVWRQQAPGSPVAMSTDLPEDLRAKIRNAVLKINADYLSQRGACEGDACLISANRDYGFAAVDDSYYNIIREACRVTRSEACAGIE